MGDSLLRDQSMVHGDSQAAIAIIRGLVGLQTIACLTGKS